MTDLTNCSVPIFSNRNVFLDLLFWHCVICFSTLYYSLPARPSSLEIFYKIQSTTPPDAQHSNALKHEGICSNNIKKKKMHGIDRGVVIFIARIISIQSFGADL